MAQHLSKQAIVVPKGTVVDVMARLPNGSFARTSVELTEELLATSHARFSVRSTFVSKAMWCAGLVCVLAGLAYIR
jgi:hypothetical protein